MFRGEKQIDGCILASDIDSLKKMVRYFKLKKLEVAEYQESSMTVKFMIIKEYDGLLDKY